MRAVEIASGSMEPTLRTGSFALVEDAPPRVGDVALFEADGGLLVHRILAKAGRWIVHAGDASPRVGIASVAQILGRVVAPAVAHPPALRRARLLALLLGLAAPLRCLGLRILRAPRTVQSRSGPSKSTAAVTNSPRVVDRHRDDRAHRDAEGGGRVVGRNRRCVDLELVDVADRGVVVHTAGGRDVDVERPDPAKDSGKRRRAFP